MIRRFLYDDLSASTPPSESPSLFHIEGRDSLIQLTCCRDRIATEPTDPNRQQTSTARLSLSSSTFSLLCLSLFELFILFRPRKKKENNTKKRTTTAATTTTPAQKTGGGCIKQK
jgi:hypothetical protein